MKKTIILATAIIALSLFTYNTIKWCLWDNDTTLYTKDISVDLSDNEVAEIQKCYPNYQFKHTKYCRVEHITYSLNKAKFLCYKEVELGKTIDKIVTKP